MYPFPGGLIPHQKFIKPPGVPAKDAKNFRTGLVLAPLDRTEKAWSDKLPLGWTPRPCRVGLLRFFAGFFLLS